YRFNTMKSKDNEARTTLKRMVLQVSTRSRLAAARCGLATGRAVAHGVALARDLGNLPANICTPKYLAAEARKMARQHASLRVKVFTEADIKRLGMGDFWGVARGSREPPRLIVFEYTGAAKSQK